MACSKSPGPQWLQLPSVGDHKCDMAFFCYMPCRNSKVGYDNLDMAVNLAIDSASLERALH